jgi:hypothetical protein
MIVLMASPSPGIPWGQLSDLEFKSWGQLSNVEFKSRGPAPVLEFPVPRILIPLSSLPPGMPYAISSLMD